MFNSKALQIVKSNTYINNMKKRTSFIMKIAMTYYPLCMKEKSTYFIHTNHISTKP